MRVFPMSNARPFALSWGILLVKIPTSMQKGEYYSWEYSRVSPSLAPLCICCQCAGFLASLALKVVLFVSLSGGLLHFSPLSSSRLISLLCLLSRMRKSPPLASAASESRTTTAALRAPAKSSADGSLGREHKERKDKEGLTCEYSSWEILAPLHRGGEFY